MYKIEEFRQKKKFTRVSDFNEILLYENLITSVIFNITKCNFQRFLFVMLGSFCVEIRKIVSAVFFFDDFHTIHQK